MSERTESRRQWPTPVEHARRVSAATAARHQRPAHRGQGRPTRAINPASACPSHPAPIFNFPASSLLAVASVVLVLPHRRHCRRSAELACASHRCIRQLVALSASPQPSPSFPPCLARDCTLGELLLALRRRRSTLVGVPPWPLPWPYFVGAPQAS